MTGPLIAAALVCMLAGAAVDLCLGTRSAHVRAAPYLFAVAGSACLVAVGVHATLSAATTIDIASVFDVGHGALRVDALAGLFLTVLFGISVAVSLCFASWARSDVGRAQSRAVATGYLTLLASVAVVVCAGDAFVFLFAWEALTVAFYLLTSARRVDAARAGAAWATAGIGKLSGASLLLGFLLLAGRTHSLTIASWSAVGPGALHDAAWALVVLGFAAKLGVVPFQVWIPVGYPAAPGPARAAMAGVAANVGVYGLWRFLGVLGRPPVWLVVAVLLAGGLTSFIGILFAGVQSRLSRVVAYSSVEHAGIIVTAYGVALTGVAAGSSTLEVVGLVAASLQMVAHAVAKSAAFCSLGFVEAAEGSDDLDVLRGVGRRLRWSGATFGAAALALAGLPPTIGFVSEWFVLEALMQQFRLGGLALRLGLAGAGALVALTTGLAALAFVRVLGLTFLGRPSREVPAAKDAGPLGRVGLVALLLGCLALAAASPWEIRFLARGLAPLVPRRATLHALKSPWVLQPVFHGFSILSPSWLWIVLPVACAGVACMAALASRWALASDPSCSGLALGERRGRGPVVVHRVRVREPAAARAGQRARRRADPPAPRAGHGRRGDPGGHTVRGPRGRDVRPSARVESTTRIVEPVESYLYQPVWKAVSKVADAARRLQSGSLNAYVAYMLVALVVALVVVAVMG